MELLVASAIGLLTTTGICLMLRQRSFPVILDHGAPPRSLSAGTLALAFRPRQDVRAGESAKTTAFPFGPCIGAK